MKGVVQEKIDKLSCKSRGYLNQLKAFFACLVAVFFCIIPIISVELSVVENLPSRLEYLSVEVELLFFLFTLSVYSMAATLPVVFGLPLLSGITIPALMLLSTLSVFIFYALELEELGGAFFFWL